MDNTIKIDKYRIMSILSLVFGAVAVAISFLPFGRGFGLLLGIAAVAMGAISLDKAKRELTDLSDVEKSQGNGYSRYSPGKSVDCNSHPGCNHRRFYADARF